MLRLKFAKRPASASREIGYRATELLNVALVSRVVGVQDDVVEILLVGVYVAGRRADPLEIGVDGGRHIEVEDLRQCLQQVRRSQRRLNERIRGPEPVEGHPSAWRRNRSSPDPGSRCRAMREGGRSAARPDCEVGSGAGLNPLPESDTNVETGAARTARTLKRRALVSERAPRFATEYFRSLPAKTRERVWLMTGDTFSYWTVTQVGAELRSEGGEMEFLSPGTTRKRSQRRTHCSGWGRRNSPLNSRMRNTTLSRKRESCRAPGTRISRDTMLPSVPSKKCGVLAGFGEGLSAIQLEREPPYPEPLPQSVVESLLSTLNSSLKPQLPQEIADKSPRRPRPTSSAIRRKWPATCPSSTR